MEPARKSRSGVISIVAALAAVCAFWLVVPHTKQYKAYKARTEIEELLKTIQPPDGAKVLNIESQTDGSLPFVIGTYLSNSKIETLRGHYQQEFVRRGFVVKAEDHFCRSGYDASLVFSKQQIDPVLYMILINRSGSAC